MVYGSAISILKKAISLKCGLVGAVKRCWLEMSQNPQFPQNKSKKSLIILFSYNIITIRVFEES